MAEQSVKGRYSQLETLRLPFLERARDSAEFTIPSLIPRDAHSNTTKLYTPYQGIGARGTNNLASKLLLALLPPNTPFFRLAIDEFTLAEIAGRGGMKGEFEKALASIERVVMNEMEVNNFRTTIFEALKHLIVAGNCLLYITPELKMKVYHIDRYVMKRDDVGNVLEIITKDTVSPNSASEEVKAIIKGEVNSSYEDTIDIFTYVRRSSDGKRWTVHQEVVDTILPDSEGTYPMDKSPFIPLRYTSIDNEDWGRGFIEEYIGDLRSLEALYRAVVEGSAAASKVLFLVKPNGSTRLKTLSESPNGAIREGNAEDVTTLQVNKGADFNIAFQTMKLIQDRLQFAFMLNTSVQRDAERVTAKEIEYVSQELDDSLGGLYSLLSQELQLPLINRLMFQMEKKKRLPVLPKGQVRPKIVTGLEALGRSTDLQRLNTFVQQIAPFGESGLSSLNISEYIKRIGTSLGVDMDGLIKSDEQLAQEQQAAQQQALQDQVAPQVAKEGMGMIRDTVKGDQQQQIQKEKERGRA
jgi:hypothetical protein